VRWQEEARRGWRLFLAAGGLIVRGLQHLGTMHGGVSAEHLGGSAATPRAPGGGPPAAHPERICPDVAPTELERYLAAQLRWPDERS